MPLVDHRYDLDALLDGDRRPRTKLVYICHPNNPTGTMNTTDELDAYFERVPDHVLTVVDQAYFEYIDRPDYPDAVERYFKAGRASSCCARSRRSTGSQACVSATPSRPRDVCAAMTKVRRPFDLTTPAQDRRAREHRRRSRARAPPRGERRGAGAARGRSLREHGLEPVPRSANFVYVDTGADANDLFERLLREGVIVRPLARLRLARRRSASPSARRRSSTVRCRALATGAARARESLTVGAGRSRSAARSRCSGQPRLPASLLRHARVGHRHLDGHDRAHRRHHGGARIRRGGSARSCSRRSCRRSLIGLLAGPLVDRLSRKRLIVSADLARLVCLLRAAVRRHAARDRRCSPPLPGIANSFFRPAVLAGVPNLVSEDELAQRHVAAPDGRLAADGARAGPRRARWSACRARTSSTGSTPRRSSSPPRSSCASRRAAAERAGDHARPLARSAQTASPRSALASRSSSCCVAFGCDDARDGLRQRLGDLPRDDDRSARARSVTACSGRRPASGSSSAASSPALLLERRDAMPIYPFAFVPWALGRSSAPPSRRTSGSRRSRWSCPASATGSTFPMTRADHPEEHDRPAPRPRVHADHQRAQRAARRRDRRRRRAHERRSAPAGRTASRRR